MTKSLLTALGTLALLAAVPTATMAHPMQAKKNIVMTENPLLQPSKLPLGAPDFSKIEPQHFLPALQEGIKQQRQEVEKITDNKAKATFNNTVLAYEQSGKTLGRVTSVLFALTEANGTDEIEEVERQAIPLLTEWENELAFNQKLFQRVKYVYDHERSKLKGEDLKLLEEIYKQFVRSGALLNKQQMARMEQINKRVAELQHQFGSILPKAANDAAVWVQSREELAGLSEADINQCADDAKKRGSKAPFCIVITNTTQQPILAQLDNRALREKVWQAAMHRADGTNGASTFAIASELAKLRAEKAQLLGFDTYAAYSLDNAMAKTPQNVYDFLHKLIAAYRPKVDAETKAIEEYAQRTEGPAFHLQPYDRFYYSAKMKKEQYNFSDDETKAYFQVDSVLEKGVFYAAERVYGLQFRQRHDLPTYHPDMKVYDVLDKDGKQIALFYTDYYRRTTKRGGAWMDAFQKQSTDRNTLPIIFNVCNYAKAPEGQPSLLTWDEVTTMFHEFGHALHGMLSHCRYNTLSGTAVARDFVEMPSQFNEYFATVPEVFSNFARHWQTHEPMPEDLKHRMLESVNFQSAYALGENLAATCLDLAWHNLKANEVPTESGAANFETQALKAVNLLDAQVPPRYSTSYFNHVWGGGYAAGYYSYLWSEVLAANVADYFTQHGALNPQVGQDFRSQVLSRGNTEDLLQIFLHFTGLKEPNAESLLRARGL